MTRFGWFFATYFAILGAGTSVAIHPAPRLIWNATASTPVGLYRLQSVSTLHVGDLIAIRPPADIAAMLARGGYLPLGVPLLKPVAALPGQLVCRIGAVVSVDGQPLGDALDRDHRGRPLPAETRNYVASVSARLALPLADNITIGALAAPSWKDSSLFPALFLRMGDASRSVESTHDPARSSGSRLTDWTALAPQSVGLFIASGHGEARR